jgi:hypothetical protein
MICMCAAFEISLKTGCETTPQTMRGAAGRREKADLARESLRGGEWTTNDACEPGRLVVERLAGRLDCPVLQPPSAAGGSRDLGLPVTEEPRQLFTP